jgi:hypothetical protein
MSPAVQQKLCRLHRSSPLPPFAHEELTNHKEAALAPSIQEQLYHLLCRSSSATPCTRGAMPPVVTEKLCHLL